MAENNPAEYFHEYHNISMQPSASICCHLNPLAIVLAREFGKARSSEEKVRFGTTTQRKRNQKSLLRMLVATASFSA